MNDQRVHDQLVRDLSAIVHGMLPYAPRTKRTYQPPALVPSSAVGEGTEGSRPPSVPEPARAKPDAPAAAPKRSADMLPFVPFGCDQALRLSPMSGAAQ